MELPVFLVLVEMVEIMLQQTVVVVAVADIMVEVEECLEVVVVMVAVVVGLLT